MDIETKGLGAGSYPDAPDYPEMRTVEIECSFTSYVEVPEEYTESYNDMENYIKEMYDKYDMIEEADTINIEWIHK